MDRRLTALLTLALATLLLLPGTAAAQPAGSETETGTLLFVHDAENGPTVGVTVLPPGEGPDAVIQGTVPGGQSFRRALPVGTYRLEMTEDDYDADYGAVEFTIRFGETTRIDASSVGEFDGREPRPETRTPTPARIPTRIDTGAGGTAASTLTLGAAAARRRTR